MTLPKAMGRLGASKEYTSLLHAGYRHVDHENLMRKLPLTSLRSMPVILCSDSVSGGYTDQCQAPCQCLYSSFMPVCGSDQVVYHSPCHAGCTTQPITVCLK